MKEKEKEIIGSFDTRKEARQYSSLVKKLFKLNSFPVDKLSNKWKLYFNRDYDKEITNPSTKLLKDFVSSWRKKSKDTFTIFIKQNIT